MVAGQLKIKLKKYDPMSVVLEINTLKSRHIACLKRLFLIVKTDFITVNMAQGNTFQLSFS